jgi:hypothetical protein
MLATSTSTRAVATSRPAPASARRAAVRRAAIAPRASGDDAPALLASSSPASPTLASADPSRRLVLGTAGAALAGALAPFALPAHPARAEVSDSKMVGAYLPAAPDAYPGFHVFSAASPRTPALRAGALDPYQVFLPEQWKEAPVSNAKSGNYCQPRCDEATTEVQFVDPGSGSFSIIIIPTTKLLIAKENPSIEDVGEINGILDAISPAITASVAVEPEEVVKAETVRVDGKAYYSYELLTPFADAGVHNVAVVTTNKNYVILATVGASEKQWAKSENDLKKIVQSFRC